VPPKARKGPSLGLIIGIVGVLFVGFLLAVGGGAYYFLHRRAAEPSPEPVAETTLAAPPPTTEMPSPTLVAETPIPQESPEGAPSAEPSPEATPTPAPSAKAAPALATLVIASVPSGARVSVGAGTRGTTPFRTTVKPGKVVVTVEKDGFQRWTQEITARAGGSQSVRADLQIVAPQSAAPTPPPVAAVKPGDLVPVTPDVVLPKKLSGDAPSPPSSRPKLKGSISVLVGFIVKEDGTVTDPRVEQSGGDALDQACLAAILKWRYVPASLQGVPVKVQQQARFTFEFR
jgi:TonB family protein